MREAYTIMEIANLKQPSLNTTLMGCIKGASDYFDKGLSTGMLFGATGHAFMLNIHDQLCPSGPYVWKKERFFQALGKVGIRWVEDIVVTKDTATEDRVQAEERLKRYLDDGKLAMLDFLEHQLIGGYDENGLTLLLPWQGNAHSEVKSISFGTWKECLQNEGWAAVTVLENAEVSIDPAECVRTGCNVGIEIALRPEGFAEPGYHVGFDGYTTWKKALESGVADGHGTRWNAMVWSECRSQGAAFFREVAAMAESGRLGDSSLASTCTQGAAVCDDAARSLRRIGNKEASPQAKIQACSDAEAADRETISALKAVVEALQAQPA